MVALWRDCNLIEVPENGGCDPGGHAAPKNGSNFRREHFLEGRHVCEAMAQQGLQELAGHEFLPNPPGWWDKRWNKDIIFRKPDFRHRNSKDAMWLNTWYKPAWQLTMLDAPVMRTPLCGASDRLAECDDVEFVVRTCRKLCEDGQLSEAVDALSLMVQRGCRLGTHVFYCLLKSSLAQKDLILGTRIHALSVQGGYEGNAFLATHLICLYASHERLEEAMRVFYHVRAPSAHNWASIISAHARHGEPTQAIVLYRQMHESRTRPDNRIFVAVLKACANSGDLATGKDVHAHVLTGAGTPDMFVQNSLVDMYAKCGSLEDARKVFDRIPHRDVVTWTAMIAGYAQEGLGHEALSLYSSMRQEGVTAPNAITFVCLLQACASVGALRQGKQLHGQIVERGLQAHAVLGNSLVNMYAKCGSLEDAQRSFDRLSQKSVVTWNVMIAGYVQQGMGQEALALYNSMQQDVDTAPDSVTFVCLLQACANVAALPLAKQLHRQIEEQGYQDDLAVSRCLVNMYAKCGSLEDAQRVFDSLPEKEIVAWGALIQGYARQGDSETVLALVDRMRLEGIQPDGLTFLSVLTVCSHVGLVDKGRHYFEAMSTEYGISPSIEHYRCMMDLLGRAGHLDEALEVVKAMPFQPDRAVWHTLLGACRKWTNVEVGRQIFESAVGLDETDAATYVLMSNIYVGAQMWEEAQEIQSRRKDMGAWKQPGQSWWTDSDGVVHSFQVGDRKHPETEGT